MTVRPNDLVGRHIYLTGQFDRTICDVLLAYLRGVDRPHVLDIGANIGFVSCDIAHRLPGAQVVAVEPVPETFRLLSTNLERVAGERGRSINAAISDTPGTLRMRTFPDNMGQSCISDDGDLEVDVVTGAQLLEQSGFQRLDAVKIDVQGFELQVLRGLEHALATHRPRAVLFEQEKPWNAEPGETIPELFGRLDYAIFGLRKRLLKWSLEPIDTSPDASVDHDCVAVPREMLGDAPGVAR